MINSLGTNDYNWNNLYPGVYKKNSKKNIKYCGQHCLFYRDATTPNQLSCREAILIQQRLMKIIHIKGFRLKKRSALSPLYDEINRCAHLACLKGPLDFSEWGNPEKYFSINNLMEDE